MATHQINTNQQRTLFSKLKHHLIFPFEHNKDHKQSIRCNDAHCPLRRTSESKAAQPRAGLTAAQPAPSRHKVPGRHVTARSGAGQLPRERRCTAAPAPSCPARRSCAEDRGLPAAPRPVPAEGAGLAPPPAALPQLRPPPRCPGPAAVPPQGQRRMSRCPDNPPQCRQSRRHSARPGQGGLRDPGVPRCIRPASSRDPRLSASRLGPQPPGSEPLDRLCLAAVNSANWVAAKRSLQRCIC